MGSRSFRTRASGAVGKSSGTFVCATLPVAAHSVPRRSVTIRKGIRKGVRYIFGDSWVVSSVGRGGGGWFAGRLWRLRRPPRRPGRAAGRVPSTRVRHRQPLHELRQVAVAAGPDHQVPVVGHHAIRQRPHRHTPVSLLQRVLEQRVVRRILKQRQPGIRSVQDVTDQSTRLRPCGSRHPANLPSPRQKSSHK